MQSSCLSVCKQNEIVRLYPNMGVAHYKKMRYILLYKNMCNTKLMK